jgi:iron(III) transport system permease protein
MGWGGFVALTALLMLGAFGVARRGFFKGDLFVAAAVLGCGSLLALFILFPVLKALSAAFFWRTAALQSAPSWTAWPANAISAWAA